MYIRIPSIPPAPKVCFAVLAIAHTMGRTCPLAHRADVQMRLELWPSHGDLLVAPYPLSRIRSALLWRNVFEEAVPKKSTLLRTILRLRTTLRRPIQLPARKSYNRAGEARSWRSWIEA